MKYYLIKIPENTYIQELRFTTSENYNMEKLLKHKVELTEEELQEIECWMNKNSQDIINNEHLCKIVEKIRKVLDNE